MSEPVFTEHGNRLTLDGRTYRPSARYSYRSESNPGDFHTVTVWESGYVSCTCKGWAIKRSGRIRSCKHTNLHYVGIRPDYVSPSSMPERVPVPETKRVAPRIRRINLDD